MTEPISLLGAAASAVQFGDVAGRALLETVKLLKNLKGTPTRMFQQLQDVTKSIERIFDICNMTLAPNTQVFIHLTPQQLQRIEDALLDAKLAMESLHQSLQRLFPKHTLAADNALGSFWRAVVSVTKEDEIEGKVQRINRLNQELMRELQIADLEMHSSAW